MATRLYRRTWAEINLRAAAHNFHNLREKLPDGTGMCCVVKADAYGHGAVALSRLYEELKADWLAVSNLDEAVQLRDNGVQIPILILGYTPPEAADILAGERISQCVYSADYAKALSEQAMLNGVTVHVHLKLDTGMGRIGFLCNREGFENALEAGTLPGFSTEGIFTHFSVADEGAAGKDYTDFQLENFKNGVSFLEQNGLHFRYRHCANSAASMDGKKFSFDFVRMGISLYGYAPSSFVPVPELEPVMTLKSVISHLKTVPAGTTVGYGRTWEAPEPRVIATVPIGYADGYRRSNAQGGKILINNVLCPIVGRVCMDQMMIDVTGLKGLEIGQPVTVFGAAPAPTAEDVARTCDTISYEILCDVGKRVPRVLIQ